MNSGYSSKLGGISTESLLFSEKKTNYQVYPELLTIMVLKFEML